MARAKETTLEKFTRKVKGRIIKDVLPSRAYEGPMFILVLESPTTGKITKVEVCATDLGWWFEEKRK